MAIYRKCPKCKKVVLHDIATEEGKWYHICRKCGHKEEFKQLLPL